MFAKKSLTFIDFKIEFDAAQAESECRATNLNECDKHTHTSAIANAFKAATAIEFT
jgi:hypothetical protein